MADNTSALISSASQLGSTAINAMAQGKMNKETMDYNIRMYQIQREDALRDYQMNLFYSLPKTKMAQYAEAGLNPNLVYGQMGNSPAPVRSSSVGAWNPRPADYSGIGDSVTRFYSTLQAQAQLKNLEAQNINISADTNKKNAEADAIRGYKSDLAVSQTNLNNIRTNVETATRDTQVALKGVSLQQAMLNLDKTSADINFTLSENERQSIMNETNVAVAAQKILNMRAEREVSMENKTKIAEATALIQKQSVRLQQDIDYIIKTDNNGRPNDALMAKVITNLIGKIFNTNPSGSSTPAPGAKGQTTPGYIVPGNPSLPKY